MANSEGIVSPVSEPKTENCYFCRMSLSPSEVELHITSEHISKLYETYLEQKKTINDLKNAIHEARVLTQTLSGPVAQLCSLVSDESVHARITQLYAGISTANLTETSQSLVAAVNARLNHVSDSGCSHDGRFVVHVKTPTGASYLVQLPSQHSTVHYLKLKIQEQQGLAPEQQRFIVQGRDLDDSEILSQVGVTAQSPLHMALKPRAMNNLKLSRR